MRPGEFGYIDWIREHLRPAGEAADRVETGPGDDCAVVRGPGDERWLLTTDMMLEGAHFELTRATPEQAGGKLLAVNISDIAAMGGRPLFALTSVGFAPGPSDELKEGLVRGLQQMADRFGVALVGGDVTAWRGEEAAARGLVLSLALIGRTDDGVAPVLRSGASVGDAVFVTGELGGSLRGRHLTFEPRVDGGRWLAGRGLATAMIDVSDGLASDLGHICDESRVGVRVDGARVPVSDAARANAAESGRPALDHALTDGEDFELAFTVAGDRVAELDDDWPFPDLPLTRVGDIVTADDGRTVVDADGSTRPLDPGGWDHLRA